MTPLNFEPQPETFIAEVPEPTLVNGLWVYPATPDPTPEPEEEKKPRPRVLGEKLKTKK